MRAAHCPMCRNLVALDDFILDRTLQVGEPSSEHGNQLFESRPVGGHSPTQMMADAVWRDQFIYGREISLVEGFIKDTLKDGLAVHGCGWQSPFRSARQNLSLLL